MKIVDNLSDANSQVDRMWERLLEIAMFVRTKTHRKPVDILKSFISARDQKVAKLSRADEQQVRVVFRFVNDAYKTSVLGASSLATDQTHFYTMMTALCDGDLLTRFPTDLVARLVAFGDMVGGKSTPPESKKRAFKKYMDLSTDRTTDAPRRKERQAKFIEILAVLEPIEAHT